MIQPNKKLSRAVIAARNKRVSEARVRGIQERQLMDAKAETIWAKFADPEYYAKEFATSAFRRRMEAPSNSNFKRDWQNA